LTATNHVVAGAVIVALIDKPLIALPLAFASHFVLDALPHFGWKERDQKFLYILAADMGFAASILISIAFLQLPQWPWLIAGGIVASSPDLMWLYYLVYELKGQKKKLGPFAAFHSKIQWGERTWGILLEIPWLFAGLIILANLTI
jgi:hypothetical protein